MNTSGCKRQQSAIWLPLQRLLLVAAGCWLLVIVSCAPKQVVAPTYEGNLDDLFSKLRETKTIEAVLSIDYEKNDSTMSGDAFLNITEKSLLLRIYYLGFLAGEVKEDNGIIQSKPRLDKNKSIILVDGLKYSFFWWNIENYAVSEKEGMLLLKNPYRKLFLAKKTLLPVQQTIELGNGEELNIFYDTPAKMVVGDQGPADGNEAEDKTINDPEDEKIASTSQPLDLSIPALWYQSNLKIEFRKHVVKVKLKSYKAKAK